MPQRMTIRTDNLDRLDIDYDSSGFGPIEEPLVMGILNVTPDSFSDGGRFLSPDKAVEHAERMVRDGADIIDIGGESTRPFAEKIITQEEKNRVIPVIKALSRRIQLPLSIDTRHADVAEEALDAGASIINDVNGLRDPGMEELVIERGVSAVIMHMKGTPENMQLSPSYEDVIGEVHEFLKLRVNDLRNKGCSGDQLIIDPGIGFGKRVKDNLLILKNLDRFGDIGCPVLVGASRKSFIGKVLDLDVDQRLEGSIASAVIAYLNGASIIRAHDVRETRRALDLARSIVQVK